MKSKRWYFAALRVARKLASADRAAREHQIEMIESQRQDAAWYGTANAELARMLS